MSAQVVFDCDDLKNEIFSYCLPQYPIVTAKMIIRRGLKWARLDIDRICKLRQSTQCLSNLKQRTKVMPLWKADWMLTIAIIGRKQRHGPAAS